MVLVHSDNFILKEMCSEKFAKSVSSECTLLDSRKNGHRKNELRADEPALYSQSFISKRNGCVK